MQKLTLLVKKARVAKHVVLAGMFVMFLPFGIIVGIGWLAPKALDLISTLKDVI